MISSNQFDDMQGMLTQRELKRIKSDIETKWSDRWRNNINVNVDEIEWVNTSSIQRYNIGRSDYVDIALIMRAVKDIPLAEEKTIGVLIEIKAEFSKDYFKNLTEKHHRTLHFIYIQKALLKEVKETATY